jgi:hypothetical protein
MAEPIEIKPLTRSKHIFFGVYGIPDIGKTTLLGNRPNTLIIRPPTDHTDSIFDPPSNVREWIVEDHEGLANVQDYLHYSGKKWDWVWLDSATLWQDHGLDDIWASVVAKYEHRKDGPIDRGEYNLNMVRIARFVRHCVGLDAFNFGWTALTMDGDNPVDDSTFLMPRIQGKGMAEKFVGYMNLVGYYHWATVKSGGSSKRVRMMRFQSSPEYYAKCQFKEAFPSNRIQSPTMAKIEEAIAVARKRTKDTSATAAKKPVGPSTRAKSTARKVAIARAMAKKR